MLYLCCENWIWKNIRVPNAHASSFGTKWEPQSIRPSKNTKRFRKFCIRLTQFGKNFAPISHQILHLKIKCPKVYLIRPPSASLPTAAIAAIQNIKMACQLKWTNRVNPGRTEQPLWYSFRVWLTKLAKLKMNPTCMHCLSSCTGPIYEFGKSYHWILTWSFKTLILKQLGIWTVHAYVF